MLGIFVGDKDERYLYPGHLYWIHTGKCNGTGEYYVIFTPVNKWEQIIRRVTGLSNEIHYKRKRLIKNDWKQVYSYSATIDDGVDISEV